MLKQPPVSGNTERPYSNVCFIQHSWVSDEAAEITKKRMHVGGLNLE